MVTILYLHTHKIIAIFRGRGRGRPVGGGGELCCPGG